MGAEIKKNNKRKAKGNRVEREIERDVEREKRQIEYGKEAERTRGLQ